MASLGFNRSTMPSLDIRLASAAELPRIVELKLAMFDESGNAGLLAPEANVLILEGYKRMYERGEAQHFLACFEGKPIACAGAFLKADIPFRYFRSSTYGFVGDVYTEPGFRGQGLARLLSERVLDWLEARGVCMVRLLASEAGRSLYTKLGFKASDEMVRHDEA